MAYKKMQTSSSQRMILREKKGKRPKKQEKDNLEVTFQKKSKSYSTKPKNHRKIESVRERRQFRAE